MITDEILLENGYRKFEDNYRYSKCLFQKRIRNEKGQTKYFIDIYKYIFEGYTPDYEIVLLTEKDKYTLKTIIFATANKMSLEEIEEEVNKIWSYLDCKYYDSEVEE